MGESKFDPTLYLTQISGKDYLETKYRLLWLRTEYPDAIIETNLEHLDAGPGKAMGGKESPRAIFSAKVTLPNGASATGWGSETASDFPDYIEKAECVPVHVKAVTKMGPRSYHELQPGEDILVYDMNSNKTVWAPLQRVVVYNNAPVTRFTAAGIDMVCTPDHSWVVESDGPTCTRRELKPFMNIARNKNLVLAAPHDDQSNTDLIDMTSDEAALLGLLLGRSNLAASLAGPFVIRVSSRRADLLTIPRSFAHVVSRSTLVTKPREIAGPSGTRRVAIPAGKQAVFLVPAKLVRRLLDHAGIKQPEDFLSLPARLSPEARFVMMLEMAKYYPSSSSVVMTNRLEIARYTWMMLAVLTGHSVHPRMISGTRQALVLGKSRVTTRHLKTSESVEEKVWCPQTEYGTFVAMSDDAAYITGNTRALGRALAALGFGTQFSGHEWGGEAEYQAPVDSPVERPVRVVHQQEERAQAAPRQQGDTATQGQINYLRDLLKRKGHDPDDYDFSTMTKAEASKAIDRLRQGGDVSELTPRRGAADEAIKAKALGLLRNKDIEGFAALVRKAALGKHMSAVIGIIEDAPTPDIIDLTAEIVAEAGVFSEEIDRAVSRSMERFITSEGK
jgi:hypothetical protein